MNLRATPFMRLFIPFAMGLLAGGWLDIPLPGLGAGLVAGTLIAAVLALLSFPYRYRWIFGTLLFLLFFGAGYFRIVSHNELRSAGHFSNKLPQAHFVIGTVSDAPSAGGVRLKFPVRVEAVGTSPDSLSSATGSLMVFLKTGPRTDSIRYGDRVMFRAALRPAEGPKNPYAFDYSRYLHFQNIHFQAFVKSDSIRRLSQGQGHFIWRTAFHYREKLLALLNEHFPTQNEYAVASALLVGYKEELSDELRMAYAETGSMHALAVSGTHVGLLYAGLFFLLRRLRMRGIWGRLLENVVLLAAIWSFTFLTGATASVLRASVMFSTYLIGKAIFRKASVWNVLPASAFILLLYNPYFLFDAGFQLSYAAVAGMVFFYPRLYRLSPMLPKWADYAWQILLVGFSAQLGTLPLSLFYFHQFPVYFWLAGWVVVFGGAVFMAGGAALILCDLMFPVVAKWLGMALYWMLWGINQLIVGIQHLPGSVIGGIWIGAAAAFCLYVILALLGATLAFRKARYLMGALMLTGSLGIVHAMRVHAQLSQKQIAIYSITNSRLMDFFAGDRLFTLGGDSLTARQIAFSAQPNRWASGAQSIEMLGPDSLTRSNLMFDPPFVQFYDKKIAIVESGRLIKPGRLPPVPVDVVILANNPWVSIEECRRQFPFKTVVFDNTNHWKQVARWKSECAAEGIPCHDVREQGAWVSR
ncbi:MAG: ComEC family competence protein [Lewinellaceae bacterium]|nr:ComEC family competence protein [Lewinellaceae bacterium]